MNDSDGIRLEGFRQMRQEIRGSQDYLVVGIDVAKDVHRTFFGTATGKVLKRRLVFANDIEGFERLLIHTEALKVQHALSKLVFRLEPTANFHKPLGEHLIRCAQMVVLVSNGAVKKNRELLDGRWDKNETKDCANVADLVSQGKCLFYEYPQGSLRDLRELLSLKRRLKRQEHGVKMRIRNHLLAQHFPELDRYLGRFESEGLAIVRWCLDPSVIAGMEYDEFVEMVAPGRCRRPQQDRLKAIWQLAVDSIGCRAGEAAAFEAKVLVQQLKEIREAIGETKAQIEQLCGGFAEYGYLLTIPGFGPDVSAKVLGAIGNPFRFRTAKEVLKLAGLDLSAKRSGKNSDRVTPVISKKGKAELRYALYQAAMVASSNNRDFIVWFTHKLRGRQREKGITTKIRVKLCAKLLRIAWAIMKNKEPFNPDYLNAQ